MRFLFCLPVLILLFGSGNPYANAKKISVRNSLGFDRTEVVSVPLNKLGTLPDGLTWVVKSSNEYLESQQIDNDGDSVNDVLIFLVRLKTNEERVYTIE